MEQSNGEYTIRQLGLKQTGISTSKAICFEFNANIDSNNFPIMIWIPSVYFMPPDSTVIKHFAVQKIKQKITEAYNDLKENYEKGLYNDKHTA